MGESSRAKMPLRIRINDTEIKITAKVDPFSFYTILNTYPKDEALGKSVTIPLQNGEVNGEVKMNGKVIPGNLYFNGKMTNKQIIFVKRYPTSVIGWKQLYDLGLLAPDKNRGLLAPDKNIGYVTDVPPVLLDGEDEPDWAYERYLKKSLIDQARRVLKSWERKGIIERCNSVCNSFITLATKPNGKVKIIFHYGDLNECIESEPTTSNHDRHKVIASIHLGKFYSVLRLFYGEWGIPLDTNTKYKTAFTFLGKQYVWNRLPGKFKNCSAILTKTLAMVLDKLPQDIRKQVTFYIDCMLISADTENKCHQFTNLLFCHLEENGFEVQKNNRQTCQPQVEFLGREISQEGVRLGPSFLEKVKRMEYPEMAHELGSVLSCLQDAKRFTPGYSIFAKDLNKVRNKGQDWVLENKHQDALTSLITHILNQKRFLVPGLKDEEPCTVEVYVKDDAWMAEILNSDRKPYRSNSDIFPPLKKKDTEAVRELKAIKWVWDKHKNELDGRRVTWEVESPELASYRENPDSVKINKSLQLSFLFTPNHEIKVIPAHKRRPPIPWPVDI